jgi:CRP-like cAMP-binding protein
MARQPKRKGQVAAPPQHNRILAALPPEELDRLTPHLTRVHLPHKRVLIEPNQPIESVYFPEDAMVSILSIMADGAGVEVATIGCEGMVGLPVLMGSDRTSSQAVAQIPGMALELPAAILRAEVQHCTRLVQRLNCYTLALVALLAQSSGCNRAHVMRQRCARWLLMVHDRMGRDQFSLTHQFLSQMLGVERASVTRALGTLQREGLIGSSWGKITVLDRPGLEAASCECYAIVQAEFARLLDGREIASPLDAVKTSAHGKTLTGDGPAEDPERLGRPA